MPNAKLNLAFGIILIYFENCKYNKMADSTAQNTCIHKNTQNKNLCDLIYGECQFVNQIEGCSIKASLSEDGKITEGT